MRANSFIWRAVAFVQSHHRPMTNAELRKNRAEIKNKGNIFEIDKNSRDEIDYLQTTLRAWYDDLKEKLLEDYHSGRYTVLPEWE